MLPLLSHASWELSRRWCVAWHSLMTIMVIMFTPTSKLTGAEADRPEERGTARCRDTTWQEGKGWPSPPHDWRAPSYGLSIMPLMVVKVKVLACNYSFLLLQPPTGTFVRTCVATPAGMLYLREVVAKCQLNHLYGGMAHP